MANLQTAQVANYDFGASAAAVVLAVAATASLTFGANATSGKVVVIGTPEGAIVYEFNNGAPQAGHIAVAIGAAATDTAANLAAAIVTNQAAAVTATVLTNVVSLVDVGGGASGNANTLSTDDADITVAAWAGGVDASASVGTLVFSVKGGGKALLHIEVPVNGPNGIGIRPVTNALAVSIQVSKDGITWAATTAQNNITAITAASVGAGQSKDYELGLRQGVDNFFRLNATGGGRGILQIRSQQSVGIDIVRI